MLSTTKMFKKLRQSFQFLAKCFSKHFCSDHCAMSQFLLGDDERPTKNTHAAVAAVVAVRAIAAVAAVVAPVIVASDV